MRQRFIGGALLAAAAVFVGPGTGRAQVPVGNDSTAPVNQLPITLQGPVPGGGTVPTIPVGNDSTTPVNPLPITLQGPVPGGGTVPIIMRGQAPGESGPDVPLNNDGVLPIPTGQPGQAGFYTSLEFLTLAQTRTIGTQTIAYRGLVDSTGVITQVPGTYLGSGQKALQTNDLGRGSFQPGFKIDVGYRFDDGTQLYATYSYLFKAQYAAGASSVPPYFRSDGNLSDTFLVSGVYNFPSQYSGPAIKTTYDVPGQIASNTYGIWNGASEETIKYIQRFDQADVGVRMPFLQTDYSRVYATGGLRYTRFEDGFTWRTTSLDEGGNELPQYSAQYTNILRQNMYGPFVGCGHEIFLASKFSLDLDTSASLLLNFIKERAKYELGDLSTENKMGVNNYTITPNANIGLNLLWYPTSGVQIKVGYQAQLYTNTRGMLDPVGFNFGSIDPVYNVQWFRMVQGVNLGMSLFF